MTATTIATITKMLGTNVVSMKSVVVDVTTALVNGLVWSFCP
jgi:hypothetical protein